MRHLLFSAVALVAACGTAFPQQPFWPGTRYDSSVPTIRQEAGFDWGERMTRHDQIVRYFESLAKARPTRARLFDYGKSWEGRRLIYLVIGTEQNIARLDAIKADLRKLHDPRQSQNEDVKAIVARVPVLTWVAACVHGNEPSTSDAALLLAYHLLAAQTDAGVDKILNESVVVIDPLQNPDGRERFVHQFEIAEGVQPDAFPLAAEHNEPWPQGRYNHYLFDMNRDWLAATQPETRGRLRSLLEWTPQVFVDLHEMGSERTYFFAPPATPFNPSLTNAQREAYQWFGRANARTFDKFGIPYFTREVYDAFFPGYGDGWPANRFGAISMTYEQGSSRGLLWRRNDGSVFTYRDTVRNHFLSSLSTVQAAAERSKELLQNFASFGRTAIEEGRTEPVKEYALVRGQNDAVDRLAALLLQHGIEVRRTTAAFTANGKQVPAGSYLVSAAQPAKRLVRNLLENEIKMDESFVKEQLRRRDRRLNDEIYDITGWSMPLLYGVQALPLAQPAAVAAQPVREVKGTGKVTGDETAAYYIVPWGGITSGRVVSYGLRNGWRMLSADKSFRLNGRTYAAGTLLVPTEGNPAAVRADLARLASEGNDDIVATPTSYVEEGVNFGSQFVQRLKPVRVAMAWDQPTGTTAAGATRWMLERQYGYPVTAIRTQQMGAADLSQFNVILLPDGGNYAGALGGNGTQRLKDWVRNGGTLVAMGGALNFLADERTGLLATAAENEVKPEQKKDDPSAGKVLNTEADLRRAIEPGKEDPAAVAGALLRLKMDPDHWLSAGITDQLYAMVSGSDIYAPLKLDRGVNAVYFAGPDELLASGFLWESSRRQLAFKPFVMVQREGRGQVIGFTADPNFRGMVEGLHPLFLSAVFRGPAHVQ